MQHTTLRRWLRLVIIGMGICGLFVYGWVFPTMSSKLCQIYPEYTSQYHVWLVFLLITAIPCYGVLLFAWRIALVLVFFGIAIAICAKAMSHLVDNAAALQEENNATI